MSYQSFLPHTGEIVKEHGSYIGILILFIIISFLIWRKK
ncbi:LPXTG cell wall anchor domain-containing protein [Gemelliphila asaccharolytica]|nr:LPXTG cell wall anchor domain-containing protein [Gemella asaccharolytica]